MACDVANMGHGLHGLRSETPNYLLLDAGILYRDGDISELRAAGATQVADCIAGATKLGATRGGAKFTTGKEMEHILVDGNVFPVKGLERIRKYTPVLTVTLIEVSLPNLQAMLGSSDTDSWDAYEEVTLSATVYNADYIDNIIWLGTLATTDDPVVIALENVINTNAADMGMEDKSEAAVELQFTAHACPDGLLTSPFHIFYPSSAVS